MTRINISTLLNTSNLHRRNWKELNFKQFTPYLSDKQRKHIEE